MAKKRKGSARQADEAQGPSLDVGSSRKRIRDFEDVADSDDEFHLNRDKILLDEGPDAKRRRRAQEQEEFLQPSDEEVLDYSEPDEDDDAVEGAQQHGQQNGVSDSEASGKDVEDDDEEGIDWGMSKDEIYGADEIETEEQALEEEAEALRLQRKHLQSMTAADYGFDESEWQDTSADQEQASRDVVTETLPQLQVREDMSVAERLKLLKSRYPEFEPLGRELLGLQEIHAKLFEATAPQDPTTTPNAITKLRAASAYLGVLAMYFSLLTSPAADGKADAIAMSAPQLRDHPVMDSLVKCRELWLRAKDLPPDATPTRAEAVVSTNGLNGIETPADKTPSKQVIERRPEKKSRAQRHAEAAQVEAQARKLERMRKTEADLADLDALVAPSAKRQSTKLNKSALAANGADSDAGEDAALTAHEAAEKAKRKKSLRFYTSQIAQKANKRGSAGSNAGGDDDIPYRERLKDRQARLNAEAEKRGRRLADAGAELGGESDEDDRRQASDIRASGNGDGDYYELVAARTAKKKADKAAFNEAQKQAALQGGKVVPEETVGADGKRKISYAIEKNKGLTPHRKKDVRNPRVKKRKKFDEKKKKLSSIKPVYKGGEGRGGYGGELTGIKKGLVKSTKL